jgi:DNA-binding CsgD family transcriptional regulator
VLGSGNAITVGVEVAVYSGLAIAARLHARRLVSASVPEVPLDANLIESLTRRERQVVTLAARGLTASEMAELLYISERTVETHLANAYPKLGVRSKSELVRQAHLLGV